MNAANIHLYFNHFPIIGTIFCSLILICSRIWKNETVAKTGLYLFILTGLLAIPAFLSGEGAEDILESIGQKNESFIEHHEEIAETAFWVCEIATVLAIITLISIKRKMKFANLISMIVLLLGLVNAFLFYKVGNTGGDIRHTEVR